MLGFRNRQEKLKKNHKKIISPKISNIKSTGKSDKLI